MAGRALPRLVATFALTFLAARCASARQPGLRHNRARTVLVGALALGVRCADQCRCKEGMRSIRKVTGSTLRRAHRLPRGVPWKSDRLPAEEASLALRDYDCPQVRGAAHRRGACGPGRRAAQFVLRFRAELFPDAPIVYLGFRGRQMRASATRVLGLTGCVMGPALREHAGACAEAAPVDRTCIRSGAGAGPRAGEHRARSLGTLERRIKLDYVAERSLPGLLAAIKAAPARSLVYYIRYSQEDPGRVRFPSDVVDTCWPRPPRCRFTSAPTRTSGPASSAAW